MKKCLIFPVLSIMAVTSCMSTQLVRKTPLEFARQCLLPEGRIVIDSMFFTPDQTYVAKQVLIGLIDAETSKIECALFRITDTDITQALINAHRRGVVIEMVVDTGALGLEHYSTVSALESQGIPIYVYQPVELFNATNNYGKPRRYKVGNVKAFVRAYESIMHHKTLIFYNTIGGSVIAYGSLNPTNAAFNGNEELVCVRSEPTFVDKWKKHFAKLQRRCIKR